MSAFLGFDLKYVALLTLVVQNSALVLIMKYSRVVSPDQSYLASTAVVMAELIKLAISLAVFSKELHHQGRLSIANVTLYRLCKSNQGRS